MPQDADGSGLVSLIWAAWIYWNIYWWLAHLSSLEQVKKERRQRGSFGSPVDAKAISLSASVRSDLEALVSEVLRRDGAATVEDFLGKRLAAYEAIIAAFDSGDRETLRKLVSAEVFNVFSDEIAVREAQQQSIETVFSRIEPPKIIDGLIDEAYMEVSIRFVGESFKLFRGGAGQLIEGTPGRYRSIDIWTFGRTLSSRESAWRVVATEAGI